MQIKISNQIYTNKVTYKNKTLHKQFVCNKRTQNDLLRSEQQ